MPVYIIDKIKRTLTNQRVGDIADMAGAFVKSLALHTDGSIRAVSQSAGDVEQTTDLVPGKVADAAIKTAMLADSAVTGAKIAAGAVSAEKLGAGVGGMTLTRLDNIATTLTGTTKAVAITGYDLILVLCVLEVPNDQRHVAYHAVVHADYIAGLTGLDTEVPTSDALVSANHAFLVPLGGGSCKVYAGKTTDGRLRWKISSDESTSAFFRMYGMG